MSFLICGLLSLLVPAISIALPSVSGVTRWTAQERWVFKELRAGRIADLSKRYAGPALGANQLDHWPVRRNLTNAFLEAILLQEPYRSQIARQGVRIEGARFPATLDLSGARIHSGLWFSHCWLSRGLNLNDLHSDGVLGLDYSRVDQRAVMTGMQVAGSLVMQRTAFTDAVDLRGTSVGGEVNLSYATVTRELVIGTMQSAGLTTLKGATLFADADLSGAKIGGQLIMDDLYAGGRLNLQDIQVSGALLLREADLMGWTSLVYSSVAGNLDLSGCAVAPALSAACTGGSPSKGRRASLRPDVACWEERDRGLLSDVDATGAKIGEALRLGSCSRRAPHWRDDSLLILRNVAARSLQARDENCRPSDVDCRDAWPRHLELEGLSYDELSALDTDGRSDLAARSAEWWTDLLRRDERFSPQPYEQLSTLLDKLGEPEKAKEVRFAARDREREISGIWGWIGLTVLRESIGYGYYLHYSVYWTIGFVLAGVIVLRLSGEGPRNHMPYGLIYSFDMLLPLVKLRESDYDIKLKGWPVYYFYIHKLMGFVLGSVLLAGLSGLLH